MKFYFNLVSDDETIIDDEGIEVRDLDQAWAQALKAIAELREEGGEDLTEWDNWRLEATDDSGRVHFSIKLNHGLH
jgi:hypothetical protein